MSPSARRSARLRWISKAPLAALLVALLASGCATEGTSESTAPSQSNHLSVDRSFPVRGSIQSPLGLPCTIQGEVRHCSSVSLSQRVPSFDGTPLDLDLYLPPGTSGSWPTLAMIHGYGGSKDSIGAGLAESFARRGYAVLVPTMRGFGKSCGPDPATRGSACANGWIHNADQRFEVRDVQTLLGWLVDEHVTKAPAIGITGGSYGGGIALQLAYLRDRVRLPSGGFKPWKSPGGKPLSLKAAWARSAWSDLASVFAPNGRVVNANSATNSDSMNPQGVPTTANLNGLAAVGGSSGWAGPLGPNGKGQLGQWAHELEADPMSSRSAAVLAEMHKFHSAVGLQGAPRVPVMLESGWTDGLFPPRESLRVLMSDSARGGHNVSLVIGDLGHAPAQNLGRDTSWAGSLGLRFLERHLTGRSSGPPAGPVAIRSMECGPGPGPTWTSRSWGAVQAKSVLGSWSTHGTLNSGTSDLPADQSSGQPAQACAKVAASASGSSLTFDLPSDGFTMVGLPTVSASVKVTGGSAQIVARLWDVESGLKRLITRGVVRLTDGQSGLVRFQLNGNAYSVPEHHTLRLELVGADPPAFRPDPAGSTIEVRAVQLQVPAV